MDPAITTLVITDKTFPYADTEEKNVLSNTWSDLFSNIAPDHCGDVYCQLRANTDECDLPYDGTHIAPTTLIDPAKFEAD